MKASIAQSNAHRDEVLVLTDLSIILTKLNRPVQGNAALLVHPWLIQIKGSQVKDKCSKCHYRVTDVQIIEPSMN